ncbi:MoaD/ThiS family protein [Candidatus Bathyarchaeota archaeon]|nr:MoaD/ThiS family protein [Candidatus Bathyarchaeota archaeon]
MIELTIRLYGDLKNKLQIKNKLIINLESNLKIIDLIKKLDLTQDDVFVTLVNSKAVNFEYKLKEGDIIDIFPSLIGG